MKPTFNFAWDTSKKGSAKVFVRKRQPGKIHSKQEREINPVAGKVNIPDSKVNDKVIAKKHTKNSGFIKRKRKKVKQHNDLQKNLDNLDADFQYDANTEANTAKPQKKSFSLFNQKPKQLYIDTVSGAAVSEKVFAVTGRTFNDIKQIHKHVLSNLVKHGFDKMTTVQEKAIPIVLSGKNALVSTNLEIHTNVRSYISL